MIDLQPRMRKALAVGLVFAGVAAAAVNLAGMGDVSWWLVAMPFVLLLLALRVRIDLCVCIDRSE